MTISKSEYIMFLKHPAWLWLKKHDKEKIPEPNAILQALFDDGKLFEEYAEKLFPHGVKLGFTGYGDYLSLPKRTQELLDKGEKTIFQGRFEANDITCIVDVLDRVKDNTFDLYEIKSSTKAKIDHEHDLAFQVIVLEKRGLKIRNISVIHVNNEYQRDGKIDVKQLTTITNLNEEVREKIEITKEKIKMAHEIVAQKEMPDPSPRYVGLGALKDWMEIYEIIKGKPEKYSIYNLCSPGVKRLGELEDLGVKLISDIPDDFNLTIKQQRQTMVTKNGSRHLEKESIKSFLNELKYPLYFLDYETFSGVIPAFDGIRPYQQIPFQYSLHILRSPEAELEHKEYLHTENTNPIKPLVEQLKKDIGTKGSILVWYQVFEKGRNKEMGEMFPVYKDFLTEINERIVDLMIPFADGWFCDKEFFGSASIKKVLPVIIPNLSYQELDIQEGNTAQRKWMETIIDGKNSDLKEKIMNNLIEYCKLDTLAMSEIFKYLHNLIEEGGMI
ncbi:hypothetical protein A2995_00590 [Candidatus Nomurabacteria bacterium RIFCSPLOWO2_01_FULL_33_24]|uniref:DUF2779 domain-containing protein n=1 Tax=Candidatus Nomurabacteria bacterium RIFCSPLOWO2_01_FULL_33_24 TaxID=1801765 RepID=A0A1F6X0Z1_9BACT|nr:MAG: hypothetical protein A2995_00590 [Candidatus Nomurabacteria bacterium RIFCSPLOWO2_01_FULL_33_24]